VPLIGFRRNIYLDWLEETASLFCMEKDVQEIRMRLGHKLASSLASDPNRRMAIDILVNIWGPTEATPGFLRSQALALFQTTTRRDDHILLHYGMTLMAYSFFRRGVVAIGQRLRFQPSVRTGDVREALLAQVGNLGAVKDAAKRITFSLRNWGLLVDAGKRYHYTVREPRLRASSEALECWLVAAALQAHPAESLPLDDLLNLPELFPFELASARAGLRQCDLVDVQRLGGDWDAVTLAS